MPNNNMGKNNVIAQTQKHKSVNRYFEYFFNLKITGICSTKKKKKMKTGAFVQSYTWI